MKEKISDLIYLTRSLCEMLNDRQDMLDIEDDISELVTDIENCLYDLSFNDEEDVDSDIDADLDPED